MSAGNYFINVQTMDSLSLPSVLLEKPIEFTIRVKGRSKHYEIYPMSLGKIMFMGDSIQSAGIPESGGDYLSILSSVKKNKEKACRITAMLVSRTRFDFSSASIREKAKNFSACDADEIAKILFAAFNMNSELDVIRECGIDKEQERIARILKAKDDSSSVQVGGKTVYGSLIDTACSRYGWTLDYVLWGISYANLRLLILDKSDSIHLSKEEKKRVRLRDLQGNTGVINADDPNNAHIISKAIREG